jgi:TRAP-type C4-dicarboxylate transport system substrate-binding protein
MSGLSRKLVLLVAAATAVAACSSGSGSGAGSTKAGGSDEPMTLQIGTQDTPGRPAADQIEEFARQAEELSDGLIRIEPVWQAGGDEVLDDWDQHVARQVVSGDLDMGMIPARAWDTEGVTSLRALQAPFLVTSNDLVGELVTSDVADDMLAGLDEVGVTGLALLPEDLRHIFSFGDPMVVPGDFAGTTIRTPRSDTTDLVFEALGATTDDPSGDAFGTAVESGAIAAAESSFAFAAGTLPAATTAVGNLTFFPKVNSLVINAEAFESLSDDQQETIRHAAERTLDWSIAAVPGEAESAESFCANGGRIVAASDADLKDFTQAVEPAYAELEKDAATAAMIDEIRTLSEQVDGMATAVAPCGTSSSGQATSEASPAEAVFPEGVYRTEVTASFLVDAGVEEIAAFNHAGVWTLTFDNGDLVVHDVNTASGQAHETYGVYCVEDGRISLGVDDPPIRPACGDFWSAGWTLDGDQLRFVDVRSGHGSDLLLETQFGGQPFTKIG